jgi:molybdopterin-guanine dinucleotide biosynthesis protein A
VSTLGVILAGGRSRRFGSMKAFAKVGGVSLLDRAVTALRRVPLEPVVIGSDPLFAELSLPVRPDIRPGAGPLGGLETALHWAAERGARGVLLVGCDMPFLSPSLMREIVRVAETSRAAAVVPEAEGPDSPQPLCAWYSVGLLPAVQGALAREERGMIAFLERVHAHSLPASEVVRHGDPRTLFLNVNTPAESARAERIAGERP